MPFVDLVEQGILNWFWSDAGAFTPSATYHVGLSSTTPTDAGGNVTEPTTGGYARQPVTAAEMAAATGTAPATKANDTVIAYDQATADYDAAPLTHFTIHDDPTAGSVVAWGVLAAARTVLDGDTASFAVGAFQTKLGKDGDPF